jgi:hypothetical protein
MGIRGGLVSFGEPRLVAEIHTAARRARPAIYEPRALACANIFGCVVAMSYFVLEMEEIGLCSLQPNASESRESDPWRHGSEGPRSARRSAVGRLLATYWLLAAHSQRKTLALRSTHLAIWH